MKQFIVAMLVVFSMLSCNTREKTWNKDDTQYVPVPVYSPGYTRYYYDDDYDRKRVNKTTIINNTTVYKNSKSSAIKKSPKPVMSKSSTKYKHSAPSYKPSMSRPSSSRPSSSYRSSSRIR